MTPPSHEQWVRWGDVAEAVKHWATTAIFVVMAALSGCVFGVTSFLYLLQLIGRI